MLLGIVIYICHLALGKLRQEDYASSKLWVMKRLSCQLEVHSETLSENMKNRYRKCEIICHFIFEHSFGSK